MNAATPLADAVVIVAGGTGALGRAVSRGFLAQGSIVIATYRSAQELEEVRTAFGAEAIRFQGLQLDVTDEAAVGAAVEQLLARHARIDVLVNTVGGYAGGAPAWLTERAVLERLIGLNLLALHALLRAVVPVMRRQGHGNIVNVAAKAALTHPANSAAYAASKAAALAMMACLATELAGSGLRANSVLPATIDTPANRRAMPQADVSKWVRPEAVADVIAYLCGPQSLAVHGAQIAV